MVRKISILALSLVALSVIGCGGSGESGSLPLVWGSADAGFVDGNATAGRFSNPANVEVGPDGTTYVADYDNDAVRAISPSGEVSTVYTADNFHQPFGLTIGAGNVLYVQTDFNDVGEKSADTGTVWKINLASGAVDVVARNLGRPRGLATLSDGTIVLSDPSHQTVSLLNPSTGNVTLLAGEHDSAGFVNAAGSAARFSSPYGVAVDDADNIFVADRGNNVIREVMLDGSVTTFAGTGDSGTFNGTRSTATFNGPQDVAIRGGQMFVDDHDNHLIRGITGNSVSTFAGDGIAGFVDGIGTSAEFFGQEGIALNGDGSVLWIADGNNGDGGPYNRVRRLRTH